MGYKSIPLELRKAGSPVTQELLTTIHDNLEEHEARINGIVPKIINSVLLNTILEKPRDALPVGTIIWGSLHNQAFAGEGQWVLCMGADTPEASEIIGSDWHNSTGATQAPDIRGRFIRMRNRGAGIDKGGARDCDSLQDGDLASHNHDHNFALSYYDHTHTGTPSVDIGGHYHNVFNDSHAHGINLVNPTFSGEASGFDLNNYYTNKLLHGTASTGMGDPAAYTDSYQYGSRSLAIANDHHTHQINGAILNKGGLETRPANIAEDAFIKINNSYITENQRQYVLFVNRAIKVNLVVITPMEQGSSGDFTIDIKKGSSPSDPDAESIYSENSLPTLSHNCDSPIQGTLDTSKSTVTYGHYLIVSVTSVQKKMGAVHLFIAGDSPEA